VCYWKKPRLAQIGANVRSMKAKDLLPSKPVPVFPINNEFLQTILKEVEKRKFDCQLSRHFIQFGLDRDLLVHALMLQFCNTNMYKDADNFLNFASIEMAKRSCGDVAKNTIDQNQSTMWKELRYGRIIASRIYEIAHCKTPQGILVEQIIGALKRDTNAMERGRRLELEVLKVLEKNLQTRLHRTGLLLSPNFPILAASSDAVGEDFVVEVKCPVSLTSEERYIMKN